MLALNLVSQDLKKEIKLRRLYHSLKRIYFLLLIVVIFTAITLLVAQIILQNNFNKIVEQTTLITKNSQTYNLRVREVNARLNSVDQIQNNFVYWTKLFEALTGGIKNDVTFSYLKINGGDSSAMIRGAAKTRSGLLDFKETLESSDIFSDINFPLSNLLEKNNINFEISAKLDINRL